jgi:hypothetical protein
VFSFASQWSAIEPEGVTRSPDFHALKASAIHLEADIRRNPARSSASDPKQPLGHGL